MSRVRQRADELEDENTGLTQNLNALQHKVGYFSVFLCQSTSPPFTKMRSLKAVRSLVQAGWISCSTGTKLRC